MMRRGNAVEPDFNFVFADLHAINDRFDDLALVLFGKARPAGVEVAGITQELVARQVLDFQDIDLCLDPGLLFLDLLEALFERAIAVSKTLHG